MSGGDDLALILSDKSKSGFKGVSEDTSRKRARPFRAELGKQRLGMFPTAEEAARAYARAVKVQKTGDDEATPPPREPPPPRLRRPRRPRRPHRARAHRLQGQQCRPRRHRHPPSIESSSPDRNVLPGAVHHEPGKPTPPTPALPPVHTPCYTTRY